MGRTMRASGSLSMAGAVAAAVALAGVAVLAVTNAGCTDPGRFVERNGVVELVGGCLRPALPLQAGQGSDARVGPQSVSPAPVLRP
jgi:hypothetical protein